MNELFKNETIYNKHEYNTFINDHRKRFGLSEDLYTILFTCLFIIFLLYLFINKVFITGIFVLLVFIIFLIYRFIQPINNINKDMNSKNIKQKYKNIYIFYKHYFKIVNQDIDEKVFYFKIYRILESDTNFYIYLMPRKAFIISKKGFVNGNSDDFSKFIRRKVIFRYKKSKK